MGATSTKERKAAPKAAAVTKKPVASGANAVAKGAGSKASEKGRNPGGKLLEWEGEKVPEKETLMLSDGTRMPTEQWLKNRKVGSKETGKGGRKAAEIPWAQMGVESETWGDGKGWGDSAASPPIPYSELELYSPSKSRANEDVAMETV